MKSTDEKDEELDDKIAAEEESPLDLPRRGVRIGGWRRRMMNLGEALVHAHGQIRHHIQERINQLRGRAKAEKTDDAGGHEDPVPANEPKNQKPNQEKPNQDKP